MSRWQQFFFCLALAATISASAQNPPLPGVQNISPMPTNIVPPIPQLHSPVDFFRQLLAMSPGERIAALTNRPPEARAKIMAKVREYQLLDPDERELRLRATELRWYLMPLLQLSPTNRETRLAAVPDNLHELVNSRLIQWDILPPPLKAEFLANDQTLHYFAHIETTNVPAANPEQQQIADQFNQFFEFTAAEKKQTLNTLSEAERAQMEKTLESFARLPPQQRLTCVRNYAKFAGMSPGERAEFLKNAENWSKMSPAERKTWRDLVANVPAWPPMPTPMVPPNIMPQATPRIPRPNMATNLN
jgi:hypothetical protein